jgi:hypothetical protein
MSKRVQSSWIQFKVDVTLVKLGNVNLNQTIWKIWKWKKSSLDKLGVNTMQFQNCVRKKDL